MGTAEAGVMESLWMKWNETILDLKFNREFKYKVETPDVIINQNSMESLGEDVEHFHSVDGRTIGTILNLKDGGNAMVIVSSHSIQVYMAHSESLDDHPFPQRVRDAIPPQPEYEVEGKTKMRFWSGSAQGPSSQVRHIESHEWDSIERNYSAESKKGLQSLMESSAPDSGGKLIIWRGNPGGGKTHAIQALTGEWKDWCSYDYIVDPENFFGDPNYMLAVMNYQPPLRYSEDAGDFVEDPSENRWRLIIVEDAGSYLTRDAAATTGQGFSRLLNLADGLLGQGMDILILLTTNEPLSQMHPALQRPGRCMANIDFDALSQAEASEWLGSNADGSMMLAELYEENGQMEKVVETKAAPIATGQYL